MSWADAAEAAQQLPSGGSYIKLADGQSVEVVLLGTPRVRFQTYDKAEGKFLPRNRPGPGVTQSYVGNVYNVQEGAVQILTLSRQAFADLTDEIRDDGAGNVFRITRKGSGTDTKYKIKVLSAMRADAEAILAREDVPGNLHDIEDGTFDIAAVVTEQRHGAKSGGEPSYAGGDEDIPF